ncbi:MAG: DUF493 domain-containing protein [Planctomycetes bacterium]|nr:DUF493 domain-containing protein [Planctomycetota bacterium]
MNDLPPIELLEAAHKFPGPYLFKAIGRTGDDFAARVVGAVRAELALAENPSFTLRETPGGRHVSVTIEVTVLTPHQVVAVYARLRGLAGVVLLL